jgi:hypothetical protein
VEPVARGDGEAREGLLVTALRPSDEIGIHVFRRMAARPRRAFKAYGQRPCRGDSLFALDLSPASRQARKA